MRKGLFLFALLALVLSTHPAQAGDKEDVIAAREAGDVNSEENKALVRQFIEEFDQNWGKSVDYLDKWFTDDFKLHFNAATMDLAAFKEILPAFYSAFTDMRHEVHFMVAEDDLVTSVQTLHMKHIGEWEGIAPTGRTALLADIAVLRIRDGKFAEEWVVSDMAGLKQQLQAPPKESE